MNRTTVLERESPVRVNFHPYVHGSLYHVYTSQWVNLWLRIAESSLFLRFAQWLRVYSIWYQSLFRNVHMHLLITFMIFSIISNGTKYWDDISFFFFFLFFIFLFSFLFSVCILKIILVCFFFFVWNIFMTIKLFRLPP